MSLLGSKSVNASCSIREFLNPDPSDSLILVLVTLEGRPLVEVFAVPVLSSEDSAYMLCDECIMIKNI